MIVVPRLWHEDDQTNHTYHLHACGHDSDVLTWGVAAPQAMVGVKAARCHGCTTTTNRFARGSRGIMRRNSTLNYEQIFHHENAAHL